MATTRSLRASWTAPCGDRLRLRPGVAGCQSRTPLEHRELLTWGESACHLPRPSLWSVPIAETPIDLLTTSNVRADDACLELRAEQTHEVRSFQRRMGRQPVHPAAGPVEAVRQKRHLDR
jgi:hypothetical protein